MKSSTGKDINLKFAANSGPASNNGIKAMTNIIIAIIMLNTIIMYLNFNLNSPVNTEYWNNKILKLLRQRYYQHTSAKACLQAVYLFKARGLV